MSERKFVILPSGSSRNKIEALADYLDALIVKNPYLGQDEGSDTGVDVRPLPTNEQDGSPDFSVAHKPVPENYDGPFPLERRFSFSSYLSHVHDSTITFDIDEKFKFNPDGVVYPDPPDMSGFDWSWSGASWSGTLDNYKDYVLSRSQPNANTRSDKLSTYLCEGEITLRWQNATDVPEIVNAQLIVNVGRS